MKLGLTSKEPVRGYEAREERAGGLRDLGKRRVFAHHPFPKVVSAGYTAIGGRAESIACKTARGKIKCTSVPVKRH